MDLILYFVFILTVQGVKGTDYCKDHFENCICTDHEVECHHETKLKRDITKLFHFIKDDVTSIVITDSNLGELPVNTFGSCRNDASLVLNRLLSLDLSNNNITYIHVKSFHCAPNIETLILKNNEWRISNNQLRTGFFTSLPSLKYLDLTNAFDEDWNGDPQVVPLAGIFSDTDMDSLETLKLGNNKLTLFKESFLATNTFCLMPALTSLYLDNNNLQYASFPALAVVLGCLDNLQTIDLSYNQLTSLSEDFMNQLEQLQSLRKVKLDHNPFVCDCRLINTIKWLTETVVPVNKKEITCEADENKPWLNNRPIIDLPLTDLDCFDLELNSAILADYNFAILVIFAFCSLLFK